MIAAFRGLLAILLLSAIAVGRPAVAAGYEDGLKAFDDDDYDLAFEIWEPLAQGGDALAQYSLGKLFETGGGTIDQDFDRAQDWYRKAAEQDVTAAQNNLALMYAQGRGVERSVERAIELWLQAAQSNHPMAQYNLGLAYLRGEGLVKDEREAAAWFRRAADTNLAEAQYAVGQMNRLGLVLPKDPAQALAWYQRAAEQGHREAEVQAQILEANDVAPGEIGAPSLQPLALKKQAQTPADENAAPEVAVEPVQAEQAESEPAESEPGPGAADEPAQTVAAQTATAAAIGTGEQERPAAAKVEDAATSEPSSSDQDETAAASEPEISSPPLESETTADEPVPDAEPTEPAAETAAVAEPAGAEGGVGTSEATGMDQGVPEPADQQQAALPDAQGEAVAPQTAKPQTAKTATPSDGPGVQVWIASAKSEEEGLQYWQETMSRFPDLFSDKEGVMAKIDHGQGGTFFRLLAGPVPSREAALDLCRQFRERDPAAFCKVAKN